MKEQTKSHTPFSREILQYLLEISEISLAMSSPANLARFHKRLRQKEAKSKKQLMGTFWYLKRRGLIEMEYNGYDIHLRLTKEGKKKANQYPLSNMEIRTPARWDRKWRVVIFDIPHHQRIQRDAFRGKIKELGFRELQKSVWVCPFPCTEEVQILIDFFGLRKADVQLLLVEKIENDLPLKQIFKLREKA